MKMKVLDGKKFGSLKVLGYAGKEKWYCKCDCGKESLVSTRHLKLSRENCAYCRTYKQDLTGKKIGSLKVLEYVFHKHKTKNYRCLCDCGKKSIINTRQIYKKTGTCKFCGHVMKWEPIDEDGVCKIPLSNSKEFAIIDSDEIHKVEGKSWWISNLGYITHYVPDETNLLLHRQIMDAPKNKVVDHIDHNLLDNRKINLRICLKRENCWNRKASKRNKTGVNGVYLGKDGKYRVSITVNYKKNYLGTYRTIEEAIAVRKEAEVKYYGEFRYRS